MEIPSELSLSVKRALARLSIGDMTAAEMASYLSDPHRKSTGFSREIAERTVCLLVEHGFLDDKRYFLLYLKKLDERLFGPIRIREELLRHKFPPRYVEAAMARNVSYLRRAARLLAADPKSQKMASTPQGKKKLMDYLARRGYDYSTAKAAVDQISEEDFSE